MIAGCPLLLRASCVNKVKSGHSDCYAVPTGLILSDSDSCRCRLGSSRPRCCWWIDAALFTQLVNRSSGLYTFTAIGVLSLASPPTTYETPFMNPLRWSVFGGCSVRLLLTQLFPMLEGVEPWLANSLLCHFTGLVLFGRN